MARVIIIGAGLMGLSAAYYAAKAGHSVTVLEAGAEPGGMAAHFDFDGLSIERFYHFICKADQSTFDLLADLGLSEKLRWRATKMGYFAAGGLYPWGDPIALLKFPHLGLIDKIRYGMLAFVSTRRERWAALETQTAREWITRWIGARAYRQLWEPLFRFKFYEYAENISAAWVWTRVKRIGRSRKSLLHEELGYIEGGSETLVRRLIEAIEELGGTVLVSAAAKRVVSQEGRVIGVETLQGFYAADAVISTIPIPLVPAAVPDLPEAWKRNYLAIANIGVRCLLFKLRRSVSANFWVNITDPDICIPGIIEFSNLRPLPQTILFVPYYMPITHPKWNWPDQALIDEAFGYIKRINAAISDTDVIACHVARLHYAQPVCEPGFMSKIPPIQTPIAGLQIADTCFYYPEDRGISESVRLGRAMAGQVSVDIG
jgi:protoporphyrinogen oxidase